MSSRVRHGRSYVLVALLMLLSLLTSRAPGQLRIASAAPALQPPAPAQAASTSNAGDSAAKLDPDLRAAALKGGEEQMVRIVAKSAAGFDGIVKAVPLALPDELTGLKVWYGMLPASQLGKLASLDSVVRVERIQQTATDAIPQYLPPDAAPRTISDAAKARVAEARRNDTRDGVAAFPNAPQAPSGWWDVGPGHLSTAAWEKGFTGAGVTISDLDSGVDFCHPDLYGTWKTYDVSASRPITYNGVSNYYNYYDGWPVALSPFSNFLLFYDMAINGAPTDLNTFARSSFYSISKFADTRTTGMGDVIYLGSQPYTTTGTATFGNPVYHIGYHPDVSLEFILGAPAGVLVVDEDADGVYETVYVDMDGDYDFSDEAPTNQENPTACWDIDEDGYNDVSAGMVYYISDGYHWPQMMDWWFDPAFYGMHAPGNGEMVAFMFDDYLGPAAAHGTLTAGNIVGQGRIDGDPAVWEVDEHRQPFKPESVGGMVQGGGKDAKLIAIGDIYLGFESSTQEGWYFSMMGVDGYGDTDDGAQISSNSYGSSDVDNDEWDNRSRLLTRLNTRTAYRGFPNTYGNRHAFVSSTGNGAPGYGTTSPPSPNTAIDVGASTQFGSTGWDSISGSDQIVWGDVVAWSNRGPSAVGHLAPNVTADGAFAAGALTSNSWVDGWTAWATWGGTSRSTPVAAGNLALVYQAWKQRTGSWPTWAQAGELLANGADDQQYDVLTQGSGSVNADVSTDIAAGLDGLHVSPESWSPGNFRGGEYPAFAQLLSPGESDSQAFTLNNYTSGGEATTIDASRLTRVGEFEFNFNPQIANESAYDFDRPDYLFDVTKYAPGGTIPANTDLMVAEVVYPYEQFDKNGDEVQEQRWRVLWYNAADVNGDGNLWTDANGNGAVNTGEIDAGEYIRMNFIYNTYHYHQVGVKEPLARWKDGIYLGLQHRQSSSTIPTTNLRVRVSFYEKAAWDWLSFDTTSLTVPSGGSSVVNATMTVPADAEYGIHEGQIEVTTDGHTTVVPIVLSVAFEGTVKDAPIIYGGTPRSDASYDNGHVTTPMDWGWRPESGDWRFYFADNTAPTVEGDRMVVRNEWADEAPETDIDSLLLGPTSGAFIHNNGLQNFNFGDFSATDPATFGPYRLEQVAGSQNMNTGAGNWLFDTKTGGNVEYVVGKLTGGLHEVLHHSVRSSGLEFDVPFTSTVSVLNAPEELEYTNFFTDEVVITSNVEHTQGLTISVFGSQTNVEEFNNQPISQDPTDDDPCDSAAGMYTHTVTVGSNVARALFYVDVGLNDLDLRVLYDANNDNVFSCPAEVIAASTNSSGEDDFVELSFPSAGKYQVQVQGWDVAPSPTTFSWYYEHDDLDNSIAARNVDLSIGPGNPASFELYNANPSACSDAAAECNDGVIYVGFNDAPGLFSIPITVNYDGPDVSASSKSVDKAVAVAGDTLTYTLTLVNSSFDYDATGVMVTDTLPTEVSFGEIVSGDASYNSGTRTVTWSGNLAKGTGGNIATTPIAWNDISLLGTPVSWPGGDDDEGHASLALPWSFPWFGAEYSTLYLDANGNVGFENWPGTTWNDDGTIPSAGASNNPDNRIAAFFLDMSGPLEYGGGTTYTYYDNALDRFIVQYHQWEEWSQTQAGPANTFQAILYPDGRVTVQYLLINSNTNLMNGPAGVENADGSFGYVWDQVPASGSAWTFTPDALNPHKIVYTVTVNNTVEQGDTINNTFNINNGLGHVETIGPATTKIAGPDISASSKAVDKKTAIPGDILTYTVVVSNTGEADAATVTVTDTIPTNTTYVAGSATGGASYNGGLNRIEWTGPVDADDSATFTYQVTVNKPLNDNTKISNNATVTSGSQTATTNTVETTIRTANVTALKTANPGSVQINGLVTFTLTINNSGYADATVSMTDTLPAGLTLESATKVAGPGTVGTNGNTVTWSGTLGGYSPLVRIRIVARVTQGGSFTNVATVDDGQGHTITARATVRTNAVYLPLIMLSPQG